jgi:hypothetical protein
VAHGLGRLAEARIESVLSLYWGYCTARGHPPVGVTAELRPSEAPLSETAGGRSKSRW